MPQKTFLYNPKQNPVRRNWHYIDAKDQVLGRMATRVATLLRGKHKPSYTSFVDGGDFVVITNAARVRLTGHKMDQKFYFSHSGWAGGKKVTPIKRQMERDPRKVVYLAVKRMIHGNRLRSRQLARLKIFPGAETPGVPRPAKAG
ncbi:MAG: 50S ribosomal protein L13 [Elusimicrobia bacterium]|nr:50S ribosomal protein L13 [Elusimicrobiota bacterium]